MQREATASDKANSKHAATFNPVFDGRKRKVVDLWQRGDQYYAQMRVDLGNGRTAPRRLPLEARTLEDAKAELARKRTERLDGELHLPGHRPQFADFAQEYLDCGEFAEKKKARASSKVGPSRAGSSTSAACGWTRSPRP